ncbi:hypothetical protein JTE90_003933 [Oedothorax gibbosus]|uniref:Uncharacterized protein n=1 Tax=Oedothorax gibbosus TaxID=931172 RepID=A0AAV6UW62_9ARAC|nr:hypothetical protein JTE90_003933 [Oedothorax gibbosus]
MRDSDNHPVDEPIKTDGGVLRCCHILHVVVTGSRAPTPDGPRPDGESRTRARSAGGFRGNPLRISTYAAYMLLGFF